MTRATTTPVILALALVLAANASADEVAGILYGRCGLDATPRALPLEHTDVVIDVTAGIARTEVVQRFRNDLDRPLEAVYIFPLPSEAAVDGFELRFADRTIRSVVQRREQAQATYQQARREGRRAALLEQERPNIFTTSVANLAPGETVEVAFSYVEALAFSRDRYTVTFPMVVGTRYIPLGLPTYGDLLPRPPDPLRLNPPVLHPALDPGHRVALAVTVTGLPLADLVSTTHAIAVDRGTHGIRVTPARGDVMADSEFRLDLLVESGATPEASFVRTDVEGGSYGLLSVFPLVDESAAAAPVMPRDVVFLIDTSGSMSGESIGQAQAGLSRCLDLLRPEDRFTIVRFASNHSAFSPVLRRATPDKIEAARWYVDGLTAEGGTEMQPALRYALDHSHDPGRMPLVVFLTDGDVGNEASLLALLAREIGPHRLFTFGIGSAPNAFLVHRMAEAGRGQSRFIASHEDIGRVISDLFATLDQPVLTDVTVTWPAASISQYPDRCPDVFADRPLQLVVRSGEPLTGNAMVTGLLAGRRVSYPVDLAAAATGDHPAIGTLFGRAHLRSLMLDLMQADSGADREALEAEATSVALAHQLVSRFTSRVAVEEQTHVEAGDLIAVRVPVASPRGWQLHATATSDPLRLLLGAALFLLAVAAKRSSREA